MVNTRIKVGMLKCRIAPPERCFFFPRFFPAKATYCTLQTADRNGGETYPKSCQTGMLRTIQHLWMRRLLI